MLSGENRSCHIVAEILLLGLSLVTASRLLVKRNLNGTY